jgi:hypothetical protein
MRKNHTIFEKIEKVEIISLFIYLASFIFRRILPDWQFTTQNNPINNAVMTRIFPARHHLTSL